MKQKSIYEQKEFHTEQLVNYDMKEHEVNMTLL